MAAVGERQADGGVAERRRGRQLVLDNGPGSQPDAGAGRCRIAIVEVPTARHVDFVAQRGGDEGRQLKRRAGVRRRGPAVAPELLELGHRLG